MNDKYQWLLEFVLGCLDDTERARVKAEAEKSYARIAAAVERDPLAPSTIAERALEFYLNEIAE